MVRLGPSVLFVVLLVAVWSDPLFFRRNFGGRDLLGYHLPVESAVHDAWARHRVPVWLPDISGGRPLAANPNTGSLYPVRPLLSAVPFRTAMRIFPVLHWAIGGLGALALAVACGLSPAAAWMAAVSYAFSGVAIGEFTYPNIHPGMALLPWVVWAVARGRPGPSRVLLPAALLGLDLLAGDVFTAGLALAGAGLWILGERPRGEWRRSAIDLGTSLLLACLLAAPQLAASILWVPLTNRAVLGMKVAEVVAMSLSPWRLLELIVPFPFGPTWVLETGVVWGTPVFRGRIGGFFATLYAGGLVSLGAVLLWREHRKGARFVRFFLLLGLALSVLPSLVPSALEAMQAPLALRYPEKFAVSVSLALALGAGMAWDRWRRADLSLRLPLAAGILLAASAAAAFVFPRIAGTAAAAAVGAPARLVKVASEQLPQTLAEAGLLWMATLIALDRLRAPSRRGAGLALAILTLVPIASNRRIARVFDDDALFAPTTFARFLSHRDPAGAYRTMGYAMPPAEQFRLARTDPGQIEWARRLWDLYTPALWRRGVVFNGDVDHADFSRTESLRQVFLLAALYRDSSSFFGTLSLRFGLRARGQPAFAGYRRVGGDALQDWDEHEQAYPDLRLLTRWRETATATEALGVISRLAPGEVTLETGRSGAGSAREGSVRVLFKSPERLSVETESSHPAWLFALRGWWPYRRVTVDGQPAETVPAQLAFSAVALPAGRHRVEWEELLPGFEVSRWGPVLFVLTAALIWVRGRKS